MDVCYELYSANYCFYYFLVLVPGYKSKRETKHTLFHFEGKNMGINIAFTVFSPFNFIWKFEKLHLFAIMD